MNDFRDDAGEKIINIAEKIPKITFGKKFLKLLILILVILYLVSGIYIVQPNEQGVVRRFGKFNRLDSPGLHYHLPFPFESAVTPSVTEVKRIEIGFRTVRDSYIEVQEEALMLTGDENIVSAEAIVQYRIKNAADYLFNIIEPELTVKNASEAALRQVIGSRKIDDALTEGKYEIQEETRLLIQELLDIYQSGILAIAVQLQDVNPPTEVSAAFKDVASAKEDKSKFINEAEGYRNDIIPKARGEAARIIKEAEGYKIERIRKAEGDVAKFNQILAEYQKGKEVTKYRLYIETMEKILPNMNKFIIEETENNVLKLLPLNEPLVQDLIRKEVEQK
ncbi:MAG: FtsH protease activity modulator HflK [Atribacterota bacterium]|nr:FtsH protease activity modulator HflK [Atribacterota bacterium]MDD5636351.1 FtsH protease activity modulator HflK [Atribacterota bacterium]